MPADRQGDTRHDWGARVKGESLVKTSGDDYVKILSPHPCGQRNRKWKYFLFLPTSPSLSHTLSCCPTIFTVPDRGTAGSETLKHRIQLCLMAFPSLPLAFESHPTPTDQRKGNRLTAVPTVPTPHPTLNLNKSYHRTRQARRAACRASRGDRAVERSHTAGHSFPIARGPNV